MPRARDLARDLIPSAAVYLNHPRFPYMLRVYKSDLQSTVRKMDPATPVNYRVENPQGVGRYDKPRRAIILSILAP